MENLLKNNSNEMKTIVETFLIEETADLIYDNEQLDKWNKHVEELGLEGQTQIIKKDKSPIPFMHLKKSYQNICEELCPRKVDVEKYDITPIPVEILDVIALSKKEDYFDKIQIWYDDKSPDPFAIGVVSSYVLHKKGTYTEIEGVKFINKKEAQSYVDENQLNDTVDIYDRSWEAKYYLLGKWADVKRSWKDLKEMATERYVAINGNNFKKQIIEAKRGLEDLEIKAFEQFN